MELRHLRYFVAVGSEANFRKAAERLHLSQPALSKQIKILEEELGVQLLERHSAGARLSAGGRVFLQDAQQVLAQVEQAISHAREAKEGRRGLLRLGHVGLLGSAFLPKPLAAFRRGYPNVEVKLQEMRSEEQIEALRTDAIDIGFTAAWIIELPPDLSTRTVFSTKIVAAMSQDAKFAKKQQISLGDLVGETLLCFRDVRQTSGHAEWVRWLFQRFLLPPPRIRTTEDQDALVSLIAAGHGMSVIPRIENLTSRGFAMVPFRESSPLLDFEIRAIWQEKNLAKVGQQFLRILDRMPKSSAPANSSAKSAKPRSGRTRR